MNPDFLESRSIVLLCHKDPIVRFGLGEALQDAPFADRIRSAASLDDGFDRLVDAAAVVVADYELGLALSTRPRRGAWGLLPSAPRVLVVSHRQSEHEIRTAVTAGVMGYLCCSAELPEFVTAIDSLLNNARYLTGAAIQRIAESMTHADLTPRELEVLACLVGGKVNKQICDELDIALGTVKSHVKSIFDKFGVATRTQAVRVALQRGLSSLGGEARLDWRPDTRRAVRPQA